MKALLAICLMVIVAAILYATFRGTAPRRVTGDAAVVTPTQSEVLLDCEPDCAQALIRYFQLHPDKVITYIAATPDLVQNVASGTKVEVVNSGTRQLVIHTGQYGGHVASFLQVGTGEPVWSVPVRDRSGAITVLKVSLKP